jgi:hypothetical protein
MSSPFRPDRKLGVSVGPALTSLGRFNVEHDRRVTFTVHNTGNAPLNAFAVAIQTVPSGPFTVVLNTPGRFAAPDDFYLGVLRSDDLALVDPSNLAVGASAFLGFNVDAVVAIELLAACGTATTVDVFKGGN